MDEQALEFLLQRVGGLCAMLGAALIGVAMYGFGGLTFGNDAEVVLQQLSAWPIWYWPAVHLAFAAGSVLWIGSFIALNSSFREPLGRLLGSLGVVTIVLGAALHVIDSFISGSALTALASQWAVAPEADRAAIVRSTETLLMVLGGTWTGVIALFHGIPFVFSGVAVTRSEHYPRVLRWTGVIGGVGSILTAALMLVAPRAVPTALYFLFASVSMVWMFGLGIALKRLSQPTKRTHDALQPA